MLQLKLICTNHHHESHREAVIKHTYLAPAACNRLECGCQSGGGGRCWLIWNIIIIISEPVRFLLSSRFQQMRARTTTQYEAYWQFCALDWCLGIDLLVASWVIAKLHHSINSFCSWLFLSKYIYSVIGSMNRLQICICVLLKLKWKRDKFQYVWAEMWLGMHRDAHPAIIAGGALWDWLLLAQLEMWVDVEWAVCKSRNKT